MDPTFRVDEQERTEDASQVADILAALIVGLRCNWPRDSACGALVDAGLSRSEALERWYSYVLPERASLGDYCAAIDYAVHRGFETYDRVFPRRGMTAAGRAANRVESGILAVWRARYDGNGHDKLDALPLKPWEFEQEAGFFSYEPAIPLENAAQQAAIERAAADGLPRMGAK